LDVRPSADTDAPPSPLAPVEVGALPVDAVPDVDAEDPQAMMSKVDATHSKRCIA
jgi:hypothetical protein